MSEVFVILMPQLNVNDETVVVGDWLAQPGSSVALGQPLCEVETSKATVELEAEQAGVFLPGALPQTAIRVGEPIGWIGPSLEAIEDYRSSEGAGRRKAESELSGSPLPATSRARALAEEHGVALEAVAAIGVAGTIKEADVARYLAARPAMETTTSPAGRETLLPPAILRYAVVEGQLSRHERAIAENLDASMRSILLATVETEVDLTEISRQVRRLQSQGVMVSLLHVAMGALGRVLPRYSRLTSFRHHHQRYRYRQLDVAFVVKARDGLLYTPVVREVDQLGVEQIAKACQAAAMRVNRGRIRPEELEGACFTVSHLATEGVTRFVALPHRFQSAILALASEQSRLSLQGGEIVQTPVASLTLSYDHGLCDGMDAASFLRDLIKEMERVLG